MGGRACVRKYVVLGTARGVPGGFSREAIGGASDGFILVKNDLRTLPDIAELSGLGSPVEDGQCAAAQEGDTRRDENVVHFHNQTIQGAGVVGVSGAAGVSSEGVSGEESGVGDSGGAGVALAAAF